MLVVLFLAPPALGPARKLARAECMFIRMVVLGCRELRAVCVHKEDIGDLGRRQLPPISRNLWRRCTRLLSPSLKRILENPSGNA